MHASCPFLPRARHIELLFPFYPVRCRPWDPLRAKLSRRSFADQPKKDEDDEAPFFFLSSLFQVSKPPCIRVGSWCSGREHRSRRSTMLCGNHESASPSMQRDAVAWDTWSFVRIQPLNLSPLSLSPTTEVYRTKRRKHERGPWQQQGAWMAMARKTAHMDNARGTC
jgi:hypothetical protein